MLRDPSIKYRPFPVVDLPDRQWPGRTIDKAPRWLSTDMRDGNQALIDPMNAEKKQRFFDLLVKIGIKEIEVGFPSAGATEFDFIRGLVDRDAIPEDVVPQVLTQARADLIEVTGHRAVAHRRYTQIGQHPLCIGLARGLHDPRDHQISEHAVCDHTEPEPVIDPREYVVEQP